MDKLQVDMLYSGDSGRWKSCIYCGKAGVKRGDHLVSLIENGGPSMYGNHPLNMVYCCRECNNEDKKRPLLQKEGPLRNYYLYVRANCPKLGFDREKILEFMRDYAETHKRWNKQLAELPMLPYIERVRQPYTEDIDAP